MPTRSLKARALDALSRREYSRVELARKLAPHAESAEQLDALLDALEREKLLSDARFAESLAHRRAPRYGVRRIVMELDEHKLDDVLVEAQRAALAATEIERCRAVWARKFDALPQSFEERAKQTRFLEARGFDGAAIRLVLKGDADA